MSRDKGGCPFSPPLSSTKVNTPNENKIDTAIHLMSVLQSQFYGINYTRKGDIRSHIYSIARTAHTKNREQNGSIKMFRFVYSNVVYFNFNPRKKCMQVFSLALIHQVQVQITCECLDTHLFLLLFHCSHSIRFYSRCDCYYVYLQLLVDFNSIQFMWWQR